MTEIKFRNPKNQYERGWNDALARMYRLERDNEILKNEVKRLHDIIEKDTQNEKENVKIRKDIGELNL